MKKYLVIVLTLLIFSSEGVHSQSLSVNLDFLNEYYRRQQLLGNVDPSISFTNRPLFSETLSKENIYDPENSMGVIRKTSFDGTFSFHKGKGKFQLLPISLLNQYNSHHPEGINDGSMIPSRGTQFKASAGFYLKYGPLSIKLKPEFVYAQNKDFNGFPSNYSNHTGVNFPRNQFANLIDLPERFGNGAYKKAFLGQSSIRLTIGAVSIGISNENLWWGPGYRNSLLMTNSAPGFMHLTLNTVRPIKTIIGSFEGQIIAGKLDGSEFKEFPPYNWRYINAMVISYQPKWVPGLFLGAIRSFQVYNESMGSSLGDYLPIFIPLSKNAIDNGASSDARNQIISVFIRWIFIKSHGEIYFEYGRDDHSWNSRDFILEPSHSSAYMLGLKKLYPINKQRGVYISTILELSNLASTQTTNNRTGGTGNWYQHYQVNHGYTNQGQLFGAGIGGGGKLQTLEVSWIKNIKQIGVRFERFVHDNDFWYNNIKDFRANWVDLSATIFTHWDYKNFLLSGKMKFVKSYNYQWLYEPVENPPLSYWTAGKSTFNFHLQVGITYRF